MRTLILLALLAGFGPAWADPLIPLELIGPTPEAGLRVMAPKGAAQHRERRRFLVRWGEQWLSLKPINSNKDPVAAARTEAKDSGLFPLVRIHLDTPTALVWETQREGQQPNYHLVASVDLPAHKSLPARRLQCDTRGLGQFDLTQTRTLLAVCQSAQPATVLPPPPETAPPLSQKLQLGDLPKKMGARRFDGVELSVPEGAQADVGFGVQIKWAGQTMFLTYAGEKTVAKTLASRRETMNAPDKVLIETADAALWRGRASRRYHFVAAVPIGKKTMWCSSINGLSQVKAETFLAICRSARLTQP